MTQIKSTKETPQYKSTQLMSFDLPGALRSVNDALTGTTRHNVEVNYGKARDRLKNEIVGYNNKNLRHVKRDSALLIQHAGSDISEKEQKRLGELANEIYQYEIAGACTPTVKQISKIKDADWKLDAAKALMDSNKFSEASKKIEEANNILSKQYKCTTPW